MDFRLELDRIPGRLWRVWNFNGMTWQLNRPGMSHGVTSALRYKVICAVDKGTLFFVLPLDCFVNFVHRLIHLLLIIVFAKNHRNTSMNVSRQNLWMKKTDVYFVILTQESVAPFIHSHAVSGYAENHWKTGTKVQQTTEVFLNIPLSWQKNLTLRLSIFIYMQYLDV